MPVSIHSEVQKRWTAKDGSNRVYYQNGVKEISREIAPGLVKTMYLLPNNVAIMSGSGINTLNRIMYNSDHPSNFVEMGDALIAVRPDLQVSVHVGPIGNAPVYTHRDNGSSLTLHKVKYFDVSPEADRIVFIIKYAGEATLDTATGKIQAERYDPYEEDAKYEAAAKQQELQELLAEQAPKNAPIDPPSYEQSVKKRLSPIPEEDENVDRSTDEYEPSSDEESEFTGLRDLFKE